MAGDQLVVSKETDTSSVTSDVNNSSCVEGQEQEDVLVTDSVRRSVWTQKYRIAIFKHLINALLADILRFTIELITIPKKTGKLFVDGATEKVSVFLSSTSAFILKNVPLSGHGMDLLSRALKIYESYVRGHMKCVRRVRRHSIVLSRRSVDNDDAVDEGSVDEPLAKQRRLDFSEKSENVVYRVYRWFTGPVTAENYHFSTEETLEELLNKAEVESYHSSQDPDYEPLTESDDTFSSFCSTEAGELEEEMKEIESKDLENTSASEHQKPYHETDM